MGACFSDSASDDNSLASRPSAATRTPQPSLSHRPVPKRLDPIQDNGHDESLQAANPVQQHTSVQQGSATEKQLQVALDEWQKQHESQSTQLQQLITLQSQEITTLRAQVIDLQAHRQQQQIQHQRAEYIKSQMFLAANDKMQIPQDCCAAAMACCLAIEEMKSDLKVEGLFISKQLDDLLCAQQNGTAHATGKTDSFCTSQSTFSSCS